MPHGAFETAGHGIIPSSLDTDVLRRIRAYAAQALDAPLHTGMSRPGNDLVPLRWDHPIVAEMLGAPSRIQAIAALIGARNLKWISAYLTSKAPFSPALWWHQDWWCWDHPISFQRAAAQVAMLCYLDDTAACNGALRVLPGSHHSSAPVHRELPEPHGEIANALPHDHVALADLPEQATLAVSAGDAVVLDYRLLHGTHANETATRRDGILLSFVPDWDALPAEIQAHLIVHPALPTAEEAMRCAASGYAHLMPRFDGVPQSLSINRLAPAVFAARGAPGA